jgi:ParB family chromosome partitioning protein
MGHARALLSLEASQQIEMARQVVAKGLSVRETESLIRRLQKPNVEPQVKTVAQQPDRDIRHLQDNLSEKLGARVEIKHHTKGHGKLTIEYTTLDELQGILEHIQ